MWKFLLSFRSYLPLKPSEFGLKTLGLCESLSGYMRPYIFYTGKETILDSRLFFQKKKGHTLWSDNYFNSASLTSFLTCCNTLRGNRHSKHGDSVQETARNRDAARPGDSAAQWTSWCLVTARQEACNNYLERFKQHKSRRR